jgi:hypothetical protein
MIEGVLLKIALSNTMRILITYLIEYLVSYMRCNEL